jgi:ABC-type dipeptide/oligopeptide/nickel transport system ATPase subunit
MKSLDFNFTKNTTKTKSFRVEKVVGMFELDNTHLSQKFIGKIELPDDWNVGVIVGRSGTGKSSIAKELFKIYQTEFGTGAIVDEMSKDKTVEDITKIFTNVGFSSPPSWLKPYQVLSNGEKMRVELAKALLENNDTIVFDEFTSVVDRDVAKVVSMVVSKTVRKEKRKFVAVTCHYDVIDYLEPDWIFSTDEMKMLDVKKNDQNWKSIYTKVLQPIGNCLETITI